MPKDVYTAIWHLNTRQDTPGDGMSPIRLMRALDAQMTAAEQGFLQLGAQPGDIRIFAAPEYYFAKSGDNIRGFSAAEKDAIKGSLAQLSATYPSTVIIAGTVAWKEQMDRAARAAEATQIATTIAGLPAMAGADSLRNELTAAHDQIKLGKNRLRSATRQSLKWYGHNTAYVYAGGTMIGEVSKSMPYFEFSGEDPNDKIVMIPGFRSGAMTVAGLDGATAGQALTVGVEICADHGSNRLARTAAGRVDIHVLVSASNIAQHPAARAGGLMLHADSSKAPGVFGVTTDGTFFNKDRTNWGAANIIDNGADLYLCKAQIQ